ncbi:MAG: helix-turn-helix transcriptional regulator [Lachnospiraceae bacterium]|nr:helix-turn-helix transcriptional regulator [Lachnospiraceae bacterium]
MSIGTTIKKLRRERDITQEQLAEYLGISSKAISQWECDKTMPDISQLPLLANIFNVTTDEILGVNIDKREKRIDDICRKGNDLACDGFRQDEILLLRK